MREYLKALDRLVRADAHRTIHSRSARRATCAGSWRGNGAARGRAAHARPPLDQHAHPATAGARATLDRLGVHACPQHRAQPFDGYDPKSILSRIDEDKHHSQEKDEAKKAVMRAERKNMFVKYRARAKELERKMKRSKEAAAVRARSACDPTGCLRRPEA